MISATLAQRRARPQHRARRVRAQPEPSLRARTSAWATRTQNVLERSSRAKRGRIRRRARRRRRRTPPPARRGAGRQRRAAVEPKQAWTDVARFAAARHPGRQLRPRQERPGPPEKRVDTSAAARRRAGRARAVAGTRGKHRNMKTHHKLLRAAPVVAERHRLRPARRKGEPRPQRCRGQRQPRDERSIAVLERTAVAGSAGVARQGLRQVATFGDPRARARAAGRRHWRAQRRIELHYRDGKVGEPEHATLRGKGQLADNLFDATELELAASPSSRAKPSVASTPRAAASTSSSCAATYPRAKTSACACTSPARVENGYVDADRTGKPL